MRQSIRVLGRSKSSSRCVQCPIEQSVCPLRELWSEYGNESGKKGKGQKGREEKGRESLRCHTNPREGDG